MSSENAKIVEFKDVNYTIADVQILNGLNFEVSKGEILILLGESGCGKTTTLKLINRLIEPTSGTVLVEQKPTSEWDKIDLRRHIGYVLQDGGLFPHMTVEQNVGLPLAIRDANSTAQPRVREMLDLVGLDSPKFANRFPHELSGGQRQRVGVARALASDPELLLLDEPFGALDAITRTNLQKEFAKLAKELGKTAVFVTHDLHEAMLLGTRIALMEKGTIVLLETPENFRRSNISLVRSYLDTISMPV
ncbi:MAG: ATP-binding cassette domain-containing protein [Pyrinomonadaceae bacterium]